MEPADQRAVFAAKLGLLVHLVQTDRARRCQSGAGGCRGSCSRGCRQSGVRGSPQNWVFLLVDRFAEKSARIHGKGLRNDPNRVERNRDLLLSGTSEPVSSELTAP